MTEVRDRKHDLTKDVTRQETGTRTRNGRTGPLDCGGDKAIQDTGWWQVTKLAEIPHERTEGCHMTGEKERKQHFRTGLNYLTNSYHRKIDRKQNW
jgi:hypothetical protein